MDYDCMLCSHACNTVIKRLSGDQKVITNAINAFSDTTCFNCMQNYVYPLSHRICTRHLSNGCMKVFNVTKYMHALSSYISRSTSLSFVWASLLINGIMVRKYPWEERLVSNWLQLKSTVALEQYSLLPGWELIHSVMEVHILCSHLILNWVYVYWFPCIFSLIGREIFISMFIKWFHSSRYCNDMLSILVLIKPTLWDSCSQQLKYK